MAKQTHSNKRLAEAIEKAKTTEPKTKPGEIDNVSNSSLEKGLEAAKEAGEKEIIPDVDIQEAQTKLEEAVMELVHYEPFYANLCLNMRRQFTTRFPTLAVNVTDEVNLFINPYFFCHLTVAERAAVIKHECLSGDAILETDKGPLRIKDIVDNKLSLKVLSLSKDGKVEFKKVVGFSKKRMQKNGDKRWVSLRYTKNLRLYSVVTCTNDHKVAYVDTPLNLKVKYTKAENSKGLYGIRKINEIRLLNKERAAYNSDQIEVIVGLLLGDSSISEPGAFVSVGGDIHKHYMYHKSFLIGGKITKGYSGFRKEMSIIRVVHGVNEQTKYLRSLFYENGKKTVKNILNLITEKSLAYWFMDDGHWDGFGTSFLHTEGFSLSDQKLLKSFFKSRFDIEVEICRRSHKKYLYRLKFKKDSTKKLFNIIAPFMHKSMFYKIDEKTKNLGSGKIDSIPMEFSIKKIMDVVDIPSKKSFLYDITVEDNHNFFADNTLVHNCLHVISNHFVRFRDLEPQIYENPEQRKIWDRLNDMMDASLLNQAADYAINEYNPALPKEVAMFDKNGKMVIVPTTLPDGTPNPDKYAGQPAKGRLLFVKDLQKRIPHIQGQQNLEYYYEFLKQEQEKQKSKQKSQDDANSGKPKPGSSGMTLDDHSAWHESDATEDAITDKVKEIVNKAVEQTGERAMGNMHQSILQAIETLNHVPRDWRQDMQRFVARSMEILIENTRKRRNRRYGIIFPGQIIYPKLTIGVIIDSSGSVNDEEVAQFGAEIGRIHKMDIKIKVVEHDHIVNAVYDFNPKKGFKVHGRGGTSFKPAYEEMAKYDVDGIIHFTDLGCMDEGIKKPKVPVLWAVTGTDNGKKLNKIYKWGSYTFVEIRKRVRR